MPSLVLNNTCRSTGIDAVAAAFNAGTLEIRTGADAVLATIVLPNPAFGAAANGVVSKSGTWSVTATGTGTAAKGVFIGGANQITVDAGLAGATPTIVFDDTAIITGGTVTISTCTLTLPAGT